MLLGDEYNFDEYNKLQFYFTCRFQRLLFNDVMVKTYWVKHKIGLTGVADSKDWWISYLANIPLVDLRIFLASFDEPRWLNIIQ